MKTGASNIVTQTVLTMTDIISTVLTHARPGVTFFPNSLEKLFGTKVASMVMRFEKLRTCLLIRAGSRSALLNEVSNFFLRVRENKIQMGLKLVFRSAESKEAAAEDRVLASRSALASSPPSKNGLKNRGGYKRVSQSGSLL